MAPLPLLLYRGASLAAPAVLRPLLRHRAGRGKEDAARLAEREGAGVALRPIGPCLWAHGASIGEARALLTVLARLAEARPDLGGVVTTGTVTSAALIGGSMPHGFVHRYAPLDAVAWVRRFLDAWRPDLCLRVDSEIWPVTLDELRARGVPVVLVNGRLSEGSARRWARAPRTARHLFGAFAAVAAQDAESAARFARIGAAPSRLSVGGALKAAAVPLPVDPSALEALRGALRGRPVWVAASTHAPEEGLALQAHRAVAAALPGLVTIIAPRHPARGAAVAAEAAALGLSVDRRSAGGVPGACAVHIADTLGELGLWYRLAGLALVGGSVAPMGGHNPYEAAGLGPALAAGPDRRNFGEAFAALEAAEACRMVQDADAMAGALHWALRASGGQTAEAAAAAVRAARALAPDPAPLEAAVQLVLRHLEEAV